MIHLVQPLVGRRDVREGVDHDQRVEEAMKSLIPPRALFAPYDDGERPFAAMEEVEVGNDGNQVRQVEIKRGGFDRTYIVDDGVRPGAVLDQRGCCGAPTVDCGFFGERDDNAAAAAVMLQLESRCHGRPRVMNSMWQLTTMCRRSQRRCE